MRPSIAVLTFLIATSILSFSAAGAAAQETEPKTYHLSGKVVNAATGEPVAGALLRVWAMGRSAAQFSGSDGHFDFADVSAGQYQLFVRKPGYFSAQELNSFNAAQDLADVPGEDAVVKLYPEGIIYGEVKGENHKPVEGMQVKAERWSVEAGKRRLEVSAQVTTDDQGNYRIAGLRPGKYIVRFEPGGGSFYQELSRNKVPEEGYGSQFYPGVLDRESAGVIRIEMGTQAHISQTLGREKLFEVSGILRGADPIGGIGITLMDEDGSPLQTDLRFDARTGVFQIPRVPAGEYVLTATSWIRQMGGSGGGTSRETALPVRVNTNVSGLVLMLGPAISIRVAVRDEMTSDNMTSDNGLENVHRVSVQMTLKDFSRGSESVVAPPFTAQPPGISAGITGLLPGTYIVNAQPIRAGYVAELRCGSVDLLRDDLVIPPGGAPPPIEVTLRDDGAQLEVGLSGKAAQEYGSVVIYSDEEPRRSVMIRATGGNPVMVGNLAAGRYYVFAVRGADDLEVQNPAAMEKYLDKATSVLLGPNDKSSVRVEMQEQKATEE